MNVTSDVSAQTPLLLSSERSPEKPVAEIVEFNAYGNKPRCLMFVGTSALFTGALGGVCSTVVASVSSGTVYHTALTALVASFGVGAVGLMGVGIGLYLNENSIRSRPAYP